MAYQHIQVPDMGEKITVNEDNSISVPDNPIIPYIEGDGIGPDIWASAVRVFDAAVEKAYGGKRKIHWKEVFAGEKQMLERKVIGYHRKRLILLLTI